MSFRGKMLFFGVTLPALYLLIGAVLSGSDSFLEGSTVLAQPAATSAPTTTISLKEAEQKFRQAYLAAKTARQHTKIKVKVTSEKKVKKQRIVTKSDSGSHSLSLKTRTSGPDKRPAFFKIEDRLKWEQYIWDGYVDSFNALYPDEVCNQKDYQLQKAKKVTCQGRAAIELIFTSSPRSDDRSTVRILVQPDSFNPISVEHRLLKPYKSIGVKLNHYQLHLTIETRNKLWLITAAEEKYSFLDLPQGRFDVEHSYTVHFKEPKI